MSVKLGRILKGVALAILVVILIMFVITIASYFWDIGVKVIDILMVVGFALGVLAGSFLTAKSAGEKVGVYGILTGLCMMIIFLLVSYFVNGRLVFNSHSASIICSCLLSGFLGGVLGR